jgi:predicted nucleic acid-binding protein
VSFLLDTGVLSELVKKDPEARVVEWLQSQPEDRLYLSVLTLGELQKGVAKLGRSTRKKALQLWLDEDLRRRFEGRLVGVTEQVALLWGRLQGHAELRGRKMPVLDGLIAATALSLDAAVVTRNVDDFELSGVEIVDPWKAG